MKLIISWNVDRPAQEAAQATEPELLRRYQQAVDRANQTMTSWLSLNGGAMIDSSGVAGRAEIEGSQVASLPSVRDQFSQTVQAPVSLGIGHQLDEADRALKVAQLRGGDRIVLYTPEIDEELQAADKQKEQSEDPLAQANLQKAEGGASRRDLIDGIGYYNDMYDRERISPTDLRLEGVADVQPEDHMPMNLHLGNARTGTPKGWLSGHPPERWAEVLRQKYKRNFGHIVDQHQAGTLQPGVQIDGLFADGAGRATLHWGLGTPMKVAQYRTFHSPTPRYKVRKADPAMNQGTGAGFAGAMQPQTPTVTKPRPEASEHSQGEAAQSMMENDNPIPPEMTHSAEDLEDEFHNLAQEQDAKEKGDPVGTASGDQKVKVQVVQVLQQLKQQMPILEQVKQSAPDTYAAVMGLAQAVIMMARSMNGDPVSQTGAQEVSDRAGSQAQVEVPLPPEESSEGGETSEKGEDKDKKEDTKKAEDALEQRIAQFVATTHGSAWPLPARTAAGRPVRGVKPGFVVVSPDAHNLRQWRATIVSHGGVPTTHSVAHDHAGALRLAMKAGANLLGEPHSTRPLHQELQKAERVARAKDHPKWHDCDDKDHWWLTDAAGDFCGGCGGARSVIECDINKAQSSLGWTPAFRHQQSGKIEACHEGYHDLNVLPEGNDQGWDSGFVDPKGTFYSREEAKRALSLNGTNSGALHARQAQELGKAEDSGKFRYAGNCTHLDGDLINDMKRTGKAMFEEDFHERAHPQDVASLNRHFSVPIQQDPHVAYFEGQLPSGKPAIWFAHSNIEHVFTPDGQVDGDLDKASLNPAAGIKQPSAHHHLNLPVGSHVDPGPTATRRVGRIKVEHKEENGKTNAGWIQARAGQVLSQDGHAISARNPKGK